MTSWNRTSTMSSINAFSFHRLSIGTLCVLLSVIVLSARVQAQDTTPVIGTDTTQQLAQAIDAQIGEPRFAFASWGIAVVSLDTGRILYTHTPNLLLQSASTAKLYTAALVLDALGTDYRVPTQLLATGPILHGRLDGSLILRGMGDPTLDTPGTNTDWADQLALQLVADGVRDIQGDLIADDTYFSGPAMGSGWEADDLQSWFAAPSSALSVHENEVDATVTPGKVSGQPAQLVLDPSAAIPQVVNSMITTARNTRSDINLYRAPGRNTLYAFGSVPVGMAPQDFKLSMPDPAWYAGSLLRDALSQHGIRLHGTLRVQRWPQHNLVKLDKPVVLGQVLSPPIMEILTRGLKRSQNLYLQNLLQIAGVKTQAAAQNDSSTEGFLSTEAWAIRALHTLLDRIGITPGTVQIEDGAGLSRQDLTTTDAMVRLLTYLARQPYAEQLRDALPTAGVDGTLEWRMRNTAAMDNVHAKTGSMANVRCVAGYVTTASGERLAFAIMLNNFARQRGDPSPSRHLDAIMELLAAFHGHP